jgi:urease accessory protein
MTGGEANSFAGSPPGVNQRAGTSGDTSAGPDLSPWSEGAAGRTGRDGLLRLGFQRNGRRTVLTERRFRLPLQVLEPLDLDPSGAAVVVMLNPTGGILGGDRLETTVTLGDGSHACLTTPAAARAYRSAGPVAVQTFTASVGEGAVLEYVPDHLIPSPGARLHQRTAIALGPRATLIVVDAWAVGRIARSEAWSFGELDLELVVRDAGGLLLRDRAVLRGIEDAHGDRGRWQGGLGGSEGFGYVANFAALASAAQPWEELSSALRARLETLPKGALRAGVSLLARGGVLARVLATSAPALEVAVRMLWADCRAHLLGLPPLSLRKL